jgi:hypothetical protein
LHVVTTTLRRSVGDAAMAASIVPWVGGRQLSAR